MSSPPPGPHEQQRPPPPPYSPPEQRNDNAAPLPPPIEDKTTAAAGDGDGGDGELLHQSDNESVTEKAVSRRVSEGFIAYNKGFEECDVTPGPTNPVKKDTTTRGGRVNYSPVTPLRAIGGASIQVLKIDDLRMFCSRNKIKGSRKAKKADICWAICRAKDMWREGKPGPYRNLMPPEPDDDGGPGVKAEPRPAEGGAEGWPGVDAADPERASKRRRLADASADDADGTVLPPSLPVPGAARALHARLVRSKEDANRAIQLRETVESASTLRREIREEKDRRANLWREFVQNVGDEGLATTRVKAFRAAMKNGEHPEGGGDVKGSYESLIENVIEQDELVRKMAVQHVALIQAVDRLIAGDAAAAGGALVNV